MGRVRGKHDAVRQMPKDRGGPVINSRHTVERAIFDRPAERRVSQATLISEEYRRLQTELHRNPEYGTASVEYAPLIAELLQALNTRELLDYGAGKGRLGITLREMFEEDFVIHHYEPAMPEWSAPPQPCRFVACVDVLEHIEPDFIDHVLDDLQRVTAAVGFFSVGTLPAGKTLSDGRNAHLIQKPSGWWLPKLLQRFELSRFARVQRGFWVVVERKPE
jgi:hypothetical protein